MTSLTKLVFVPSLIFASFMFFGCGDVEWNTQSAAMHFRPVERNTVFVEEHMVPVGQDVVLHVVEQYSLASLWRRPRRAILLLTGTLVTNAQYNSDVTEDGSYNALHRCAQEGYFAFSATYEGYGLSSHPEDGSSVTADRLLVEMGEVVEWIRRQRGVRRVDLMGSSLGSTLAVALGGVHSPINRHKIRKLVLTSVVYKDVTPLMKEVLFSPEVRDMLENAPNGYIMTVPEVYGIVLSAVEPEVLEWAASHLPGVYATGPTLEGFELPVYDAADGRAPALQVWGDQDLVTPFSDVEEFQNEYGGPIRLVVAEGGAHAPNLEPIRDVFWQEVFDFLDHPRRRCRFGRFHRCRILH